ncbi:LCP family protein [Knoellia aerolata]|uniref:LCP family protein n=1 Tax=Knoellia aerolata TaxID=442954 RepID=UPI000A4A14E0|nr:LCP family protein [Knoellia aerolata]
MHIPEDKQSAYLIHFPRDLYVSIPGRGKDKINAAYAYGGAPLLVITLQDPLGTRIDHVAKTDFKGLKGMTDAVGGVGVYAEEPSDASGTLTIREGWNDLNGDEALAFVRDKYDLSEGDISRGGRKQAFIKALMMKAISRESSPTRVKLAGFVDAASANLVVDKGLPVSKLAARRSPCVVWAAATSCSPPRRSPASGRRPTWATSTSSTRPPSRRSARPCAPTRWTATPTSRSSPDNMARPRRPRRLRLQTCRL